MNTIAEEATQILQTTLGKATCFREGQLEAIEALVQHRQKLLVVQRTGWGKSVVYFVATRLMRRRRQGITILISPLLSLMRNQVEAAESFGVKTIRMDSTNYESHNDFKRRLLADDVDLLLISPERLANENFRQEVWSVICSRIGLLVVDEAHCISDWGHDFRPNYRRILDILGDIRPNTAILGTTATANDRVISDIQQVLGGEVYVLRGSLTRSSLQLYTYVEEQSIPERMVLLSYLLSKLRGSGIIYCTTTRDCNSVAAWLRHEGYDVEAYHADETHLNSERSVLEQKLAHNQVKALVATVALGMGFDKPDLGFVIHFQLPGSIISYYQQIGRAGRGIDNAHIILMHGDGDRDIQRYFIERAFPSQVSVEAIIHLLHTHGDMTRGELQEAVNISRGSLDRALEHLEIAKIVGRTDGQVHLLRKTTVSFETWAKVTEQRYIELNQMEAYISEKGCMMQFLSNALEDSTPSAPCGHCQNCRNAQSKYVTDPAQVALASRFLRDGDPIWLEGRKQWPRRNMMNEKTTITLPNETGLSLSFYNDGGYGHLVKTGKYQQHHFSDELVEASVNLIQTHWREILGCVTNIPSTRHPTLVEDFARRLAAALRLPFRPRVLIAKSRPEQKMMQNSVLQAQNVIAAFDIGHVPLETSVLLVDDVWDSGWTMTLAGFLLRKAGASAVYPFVLAKATGRT